jgi:hypothetical protein
VTVDHQTTLGNVNMKGVHNFPKGIKAVTATTPLGTRITPSFLQRSNTRKTVSLAQVTDPLSKLVSPTQTCSVE